MSVRKDSSLCFRSNCMRSNSFLGVGGVSLKCALPHRLAGGVGLSAMHFCTAKCGLRAFAGCSNCSPRMGACPGGNLAPKVS